MSDTKIIISPAFFIVIAASAIFDTSGTFSVVLFAVMIHEFGHIFALSALGIRIDTVRLRMFGLEICADIPRGKREALVMAAGPCANLLSAALFLLFRSEHALSLAACSVILGVFHLMPCEGLDGGSALKALFYRKKCENTVNICVKAFTVTLAGCFVCAALHLVLTERLNLSLIVLPVYLILNLISERKTYTCRTALT